MAAPPSSQLDANQCIQGAYDDALGRLRVEGQATIVNGALEVSISSVNDNIAIRNTGNSNELLINADGSINVVGGGASNLSVGLTGTTAPTSATEVGGINPSGNLQGLKVDASGYLLTSGSTVITGTSNQIEVGTVQTAYNEILAVASGVETQIVSFTATSSSRIKIISASGTNIGTYIVYVNSVAIHKKRTYFGGELNSEFDFSKGYMLATSDVVKVTILHNRPYVGDFNAFILVLTNS